MSAYTNTRTPIPLQTEQMKILNQIGSYCDSTKCFASFIPIFIFICVSLPVVHSAHYVYSEWLDFSQLLPLFGSVFECTCICEYYSVLYLYVRVKFIQIIVQEQMLNNATSFVMILNVVPTRTMRAQCTVSANDMQKNQTLSLLNFHIAIVYIL